MKSNWLAPRHRAMAVAVAVAIAAATVWYVARPAPSPSAPPKVPALSPLAAAGQGGFEANCARCHGTAGMGSDKGPALVHDIYNPGHHDDLSFVLAARRGVQAHHWRFGDMPAQPDVGEDQIGAIIRYVRELQDANGIRYRPHRM